MLDVVEVTTGREKASLVVAAVLDNDLDEKAKAWGIIRAADQVATIYIMVIFNILSTE
jgi:hypothetical protein